jgi:hypothetical protein
MDRFGNDTTDSVAVDMKLNRIAHDMISNEKANQLYHAPRRMIEKETETLQDKVKNMRVKKLYHKNTGGCKCEDSDSSSSLTKSQPEFKETKYKKQVPIIGGSNVDMVENMPVTDSTQLSASVPDSTQLSASVADRMIGSGKSSKPKEIEGSSIKSKVESKVDTKVQTDKGKKQPSEWQTLVTKTMKDKSMTMKNAMKYIKENNLYQKKK